MTIKCSAQEAEKAFDFTSTTSNPIPIKEEEKEATNDAVQSAPEGEPEGGDPGDASQAGSYPGEYREYTRQRCQSSSSAEDAKRAKSLERCRRGSRKKSYESSTGNGEASTSGKRGGKMKTNSRTSEIDQTDSCVFFYRVFHSPL